MALKREWLPTAASLGIALAGFLVQASAAVAADTVSWPRGIYWDRGNRMSNDDKIKYFRSIGVSVVHIWLNDNTLDKDKLPNCKAFIYMDSALGQTYWKAETLRDFTVALQNATPPLKPIYTFSPLEQTEDYIESLSAPGQPLMLARDLHVDVELDLENNFREDGSHQGTCASGGKDTALAMTRKLIAAIKDTDKPEGERKPLTLIVSTTDDLVPVHEEALAAANIVAPQLYEADFAQEKDVISKRLGNTWSKYKVPFMPGFSLGCPSKAANAGKCSEKIFTAGLSYVAGLARCPTVQKDAPSYVLWSAVRALPGFSTIANSYLLDPKKQMVPVDCKAP